MARMNREGANALARLVESTRPRWDRPALLARIYAVMRERGEDTSAAVIAIGFLAAADNPYIEDPSEVPTTRAHWRAVGAAFLQDPQGRRHTDKHSARTLAAARAERARPAATRSGYLAATALLQAQRPERQEAGTR